MKIEDRFKELSLLPALELPKVCDSHLSRRQDASYCKESKAVDIIETGLYTSEIWLISSSEEYARPIAYSQSQTNL